MSQLIPTSAAPINAEAVLERDVRATAVAQRIIARHDPLAAQPRHNAFLAALLAEAYAEGLADARRAL